jgi:hypothetical protein
MANPSQLPGSEFEPNEPTRSLPVEAELRALDLESEAHDSPNTLLRKAVRATHDKLVEVYEAWKRAGDEHRDMMDDVMQGKPLDAEAMKQKRTEIEALHGDWIALASRHVD